MIPEGLTTGQGTGELSTRRLLLLLALYFLLHFTLRVLVSASLELDEAEQLVLAQQLRWGYGSQPPLYTWLIGALFSLFGPGVVALAALKNLLLFALYLLTFLAGRKMGGDDRTGLAAAFSLLLLPQIAWEAQRDLTHSVLATACAAATLYAGALLLRSGRIRHFLLFGFCCGLGVLGKYNYIVFLAAFLGAALTIPEYRARLLRPVALTALLSFLPITAGHLFWLARHTGETLTQAGTFHIGHTQGWLSSYAIGLAALAKAVVAFSGPAVLIYLLLVRRQLVAGSVDNPFCTLVGRSLLFGIAICLMMIVGFRVTNFKDRWMQPILFHCVLYLALRSRPHLDAARLRRLLLSAAAVAVLVLAVMPARTLLAGRLGSVSRLNAPWTALAGQLRQAGFTGGNIAAEQRLVGGNLLLQFPQSTALVPELPTFPARPDAPWLIVWNAGKHERIPEPLAALVRHATGRDPSGMTPAFVDAPYLHAPSRRMRLAYLLLPAKTR